MRLLQYTYFQFKDLVEYAPYDSGVSLQTLLTDYGINYTIATGSKIEDLFKKTYARFYDYFMFAMPTKDTSNIAVEQQMCLFLIRFLNQYENTKIYYETLVKAYDDNLSKVMLDVEATTDNEVIFNDTPQTEGGIFKTTDYATTYTKTSSKSKTPMKTPIERLKDLQDNLMNVWKNWTNEMSKIFIEDQEGEIYEELA